VEALRDGVGFVGAGSLAGFLAEGMLAGGLAPEALWVSSRGGGHRLERFTRAGIRIAATKAELAAHARVLLLLVKPKDANDALRELAPWLRADHVVVSCMAGIPCAFVEETLGGGCRVLRAMPNIASASRLSVTALAAGRHAEAADVAAVTELLQTVGMVVPLPEAAFDTFTAVCGSGPAYVFLLMEALIAAAADLGVPDALLRRMVVQVVLGAAQVAASTGRAPEELRASVSSPAGTTVAALEALEEAGLRAAVAEAVRRGTARSRALGLQWASLPAER
jgi:pyrroline-5-carboxylate reductase